MSEKHVAYKVGVFVVATLIVAATMVIVLGGFSFRSGYSLRVDYAFSGNVKPGAPVKLAGIKVGHVEDVALLPLETIKNNITSGERPLVRVHLWVEDRVAESLRQDAEFFINTSGVLGEQYVEIVPGTDYEHPPLGKHEEALRGTDPPRTDLIVSRLYMVLDSLSRVLVEDREYIRKLLVDGAGSLHALNGILQQNQGAIHNLLLSANTLAQEAGQGLHTLNAGMGPKEVRNTIEKVQRLLTTSEGSLRTLTPPAQALLDDAKRVTSLLSETRIQGAFHAVEQASILAEKSSKVVDKVDGLMRNVVEGKGSIGALLVREELYADLREMLRDLKKNPWKFFWKE